jgi:hypothetical protein
MNQGGMPMPGPNGGMNDKNFFMNYLPGPGQMNSNPMMGVAPIPLGQIRPGFMPPQFGMPGK